MKKYLKASKVPEDGASASMEKLQVSSGDVSTHPKLLERGVDGDFRGNFYENQCSFLKQHLTDAESMILIKESAVDHAASGPSIKPKPALEELRRLIEAGRTLIKGCEAETCKKAYLRWGERTEAFAETVEEMLWCLSLVFYYERKRLGPGDSAMTMNDFPLPGLGEKELYLLGKAASDDQNKLRDTLDSWWKRHINRNLCSAVECGSKDGSTSCLAAQIASQRGKSYSRADPTPVWKVTQKEAMEDGKEIGFGGYGKVSRVKWLGDEYAMKTFWSHAVSPMDEVTVMANLSHPHIVKPFACSGQGLQPFFFLMELMPYDLKKFLEDVLSSSFSLLERIDLMLQISEAMRFIHDKGMVHRDLKPGNILLRPLRDPKFPSEGPQLAKVADFGLAKVKEEVISHTQVTQGLSSGAQDWKAPELLSKNRTNFSCLRVHYTRKADVYSFGIICYQILTNSTKVYDFPFEAFYEKLTKDNIRPDIPETCPGGLASLIRKCWQTDPLGRPTFGEISATLRYFKGLLLLEQSEDTIKEQTPQKALFRTDMVMSQGPFGVSTSYTRPLDYYGLGTGVRAIQIFTRPHIIKPYESNVYRGSQVIGFRVQYDLNGRTMEALHGSDKHSPQSTYPAWIHFSYPGEELTKVRGWTTSMPNAYHKDYPGPFVTSLTFITNRATYGPYGTHDEPGSEEFTTSTGRVVGFFGWSGSLLHSIGVLIAPGESDATSGSSEFPCSSPQII